MSLRFENLRPDQLAPYVDGLRALEHDIEYPIADGADSFRIDHGPLYHPFFSSMGECQVIVALDGDRVIGTIAGVLREGLLRGRTTNVMYGADMKVAKSHRGQGVPRKMLFYALRKLVTEPRGTSWRYSYVAAMRGAKGDVMRTVSGVHPAKLAHPAAELMIYFTPPEQLAALDLAGAPTPPAIEEGIDLSPWPSSPMVSTAGRKDLRLRSTGGAPWPLVHLPYGPSRPSWASYLKECGNTLKSPSIACFGLDVRLREHAAFLANNGVEPGAVCTVYALSLTPRTRGARWLHLSTAEI
ncbi:MAG: GNAT family N-acetyltransferase [Polyangiales bacterium]